MCNQDKGWRNLKEITRERERAERKGENREKANGDWQKVCTTSLKDSLIRN